MTFPILQDKVALVTGVAMGMGRDTALLFAQAGARVVVADLNEEQGARTADDITAAGGSAVFHRVDISESREVEALIAAVIGKYERLDVAVNNAAIKPDDKPIGDFDEDYWDRLHSVDLKGTALCMKYEIRHFLGRVAGPS